jgi:hypothetical protein
MSSKYVRDFARGLAPKISTKFYDTINTDVSPTDALWMTMTFDAYTKEVDTYCRSTTEYGVINLIFFGNPGIGDGAILTAAEADAASFYGQSDSSGRLVFTSCSAPEELMVNDGSPDYVVSVAIDYEFYTV